MGSSEKPDLPGVNRLVKGAKEQSSEFNREARKGHIGRFLQDFNRQIRDKGHRGSVNPLKALEKLCFGGIVRWFDRR